MRRPLTTVLLAGLIALAVGACASTGNRAASTTNARGTTGTAPSTTTATPTATTPGTPTSPANGTPAPASASFPVALPAQTALAFDLHEINYLLVGTQRKLRSVGEALAVTRDRVGYVACRAGAPLHSIGLVSPAVVARFTALLRDAHLSAIRSDPVRGQGRVYWFDDGAYTLRLDFARHVHRAPCQGTMCAAMIEMDGSLRAVLPATVAMTSFIGSHCAQA